MNSEKTASVVVWEETIWVWAALIVAILLLLFVYFDGLKSMENVWSNREEYSHGYLIPFIALFFIWQRSDRLREIEFSGSWVGAVVTALGLALYIAGELSSLYIIVQYAFLVTLFGVVLSLTGWRGFGVIWVPLLILVFMIPLPAFLFRTLSSELQLISSHLGVVIIRLFDISVYLESNVIDLGNYKLQVVEACSGLRYLFPLMALSFIAAYFFKVAFWKRVVVFLSSIPITIFMNSFRIGVIGVLVDNWGIEQAEGFLHYFEGWVIFMACTAILVGEIWVLSKIGGDKRPFREVFGLDLPDPPPEGAMPKPRRVPPSLLGSLLLLATSVAGSSMLEERSEILLDRQVFGDFPMRIGGWTGKTDRLEKIYIDALDVDDYLLSDFTNSEGDTVGFYVAYYDSQRKGESAHSPRACLPGGGWQIKDFMQISLDGVKVSGIPVRANRVLIKKGEYTQIVYYWFQQRDRVLANEYLVRWYLFWDALTRNRTDGALVRLTANLMPGEDPEEADRHLVEFAGSVSDILPKYIPN
jgi:exosortase D (VPLPA-CTERM-specific)